MLQQGCERPISPKSGIFFGITSRLSITSVLPPHPTHPDSLIRFRSLDRVRLLECRFSRGRVVSFGITHAAPSPALSPASGAPVPVASSRSSTRPVSSGSPRGRGQPADPRGRGRGAGIGHACPIWKELVPLAGAGEVVPTLSRAAASDWVWVDSPIGLSCRSDLTPSRRFANLAAIMPRCDSSRCPALPSRIATSASS